MRKKIMSISTLVTLLLAFFTMSHPALAKSRIKRTIKEDKQLVLPDPSTTKVAITPFWNAATDKDKKAFTKWTSERLYELFQKAGFQIVPEDRVSQALKDLKIDTYWDVIQENEARKIAEATGADWVVYGKVQKARIYYARRPNPFSILFGIGGRRRRADADIELAIYDAKKDRVFLRKLANANEGSGVGFLGFHKTPIGKMKRRAIRHTLEFILGDLFLRLAREKKDTKIVTPSMIK